MQRYTSEDCSYCPVCKGQHLEYGKWELVDESGYYEFTCSDCGSKGKEWYVLTYSSSEAEAESFECFRCQGQFPEFTKTTKLVGDDTYDFCESCMDDLN